MSTHEKAPPCAIRLMMADDVTAVVALLEAQLDEHDIPRPKKAGVTDSILETVRGMYADPQRGFILVADQQNDVVGVAYLAATWTLEHGGASIWLEELFVKPALRERGIGQALLKEALRIATERGYAAVDLEVESSHSRAQNLYRRFGFIEHSRTRFALALGLMLCALVHCDGDAMAPLPAIEPPPMPVTDPGAYVVPFIGSGGFAFRFGSAFVGATAPHGMAKVGPDTKGPFGTVNFLHYSGYWYGDDTVQGFSHMHLHGTGACDYGILAVMPLDDFSAARTGPDGYGAPMHKDTEVARPGYYAVTLARGEIRSEITATLHAAHHRYSYGAAVTQKALLFDLDHHLSGGEVDHATVEIDAGKQTIRGQLHSLGGMSHGYGGYEVYFVARVKTPWSSQLLWSNGSAPAAGTTADGTGVGLVLLFENAPTGDGPAGAPIELQVGLSLVSMDAAQKNLDGELADWQFDSNKDKSAAAWTDRLQTLRISGGSEADRRTFYSALYRAHLMPSVHSDLDGSYVGFDGKAHSAAGFRYVSDMSLWDTYRTLHPLYSLIAPDDARDSVRSLLAMAQTSGAFPKWPLAGGDSGTMLGAPAELVVADAYLKGVLPLDADAEAAYAILSAAALDPTAPPGGRGGRDHVEDYMRLGYVPSYVGASVSWTTEYARGDYALGQLAQALGHSTDAQTFSDRAHSYRNVYDAKSGFLRARGVDGSFSWMTYDPQKYSDDYDEANGWQSLFMNDHDAMGLSAMFGSADAMVAKLSDMFTQSRAEWEASDQTLPQAGTERPSYYWAGNEPDIGAPYLFATAGHSELTQRWVRWLMATQYNDTPAGLPGNDDGGTMSAWYVFSALGFYPIAGSDRYMLGAPLFPRIEISVPGGVFTIEAPGAAADRPYATAITLDGVPLTSPELRHSDLRAGRTLRYTISSDPAP